MSYSQKLNLLIPNFSIETKNNYSIKKREFGVYKSGEKVVYSVLSPLEIIRIDNQNYEAYYPEGIFNSKKNLYFLEPVKNKISEYNPKTVYFTHNEKGDLSVKNLEDLMFDFVKLKDIFLDHFVKQEVRQVYEDAIELYKDERELKKIIFEDLQYIFAYYGLEKVENKYIDFNLPEASEITFNTNNTNSADLLMFDQLEFDKYKIEALISQHHHKGINAQTEIIALKRDFLNGKYYINKEKKITSHHKKFIYNDNNILEKFDYNYLQYTDQYNSFSENIITLVD